jgi:hypothetical protein
MRDIIGKRASLVPRPAVAVAVAFAVGMALAAGSRARADDIATGNMHFSAKDMDMNGDQMISRDEFMAYGEKMWGMMSKGASTISVEDAAQDFARGNMRFSAKAMDTDHDGTISKDEFMAYGGKKFDMMKNKSGMMSVDDVAWNFARGNRQPGSAKTGAKTDSQ